MEANLDEQQTVETSTSSRTARKVALRLCGVSATDRLWILVRLTPAQRGPVEEAYRQLQQIKGNAPLDFGLFFASENETDSGSGALEILPINQLPFDAVRKVLDELPPAHVAAIVRSGLWREAGRYLVACQKRRRQAITAVSGPLLTETAARALVDAVARQSAAERG